ncbi:MAG TPA: discoidin domain-containing protein, partial [Acidimicrobiia bacterium]|nr:discoidin domain-containing protein [Acidimicrobiia bacterium]
VVEDDNVGSRANYIGTSGVGFAEIRLGEAPVRVQELVRMPTDLTGAPGAGSLDHRLVYVMNRSRTILIPPRYSEDELALARVFEVPAARDFELGGTARLSTAVPDEIVDALLGLPAAAAGGVSARSSERLPGSVLARSSSAIDGDPATAWSTGFGAPAGQWMEIDLAQPATFDGLDLQVVADGRHSVPTRIRIDADGQTRTVDLPEITDQPGENATVAVPVSFEPVTATTVRVTIEAVREIETREYFSDTPIITPVALAELGLAGVTRPPTPPALPGDCRRDLLTVDGEVVPIRVAGTTAAAETLAPLAVERCDTTVPITLADGDHELVAAAGADTGIDLDDLTIGSEAGGGPLALGERGTVPPVTPARAEPPRVEVVESGRTEMTLRVTGADAPFWLVLGQSQNRGWKATVDGDDRGGSELVNGYANGWLLTPNGDGTMTVTLTWTPQRTVWIALGLSGLAMVLCTVLALGLWPRRRGAPTVATATPAPSIALPWQPSGTRPSHAARIAGPALAAVAGGALVNPIVGVVIGALVLVAVHRPQWRAVLAIGAPVSLALAGLYIFVQQWRHWYPSVFEWPTFFDRVHVLGWLALAFLAADALVEALRSPPHEPAEEAVQPQSSS